MGWREKISPEKAWKNAIKISFFFGLAISMLTILSIHNIFFPWTRNDFVEYEGTLDGVPVFKNGKHRNLTINITEDNGFQFLIDGDNYSVLKNIKIIEKLESGDKVSILVDKSQFNTKILRSSPSTFLQRIINWNQIRVYEFKTNDVIFLDFKEVICELKKVSKFYLIFVIICYFGIYFYLKYEYRVYLKSKIINPTSMK